MPTTSLSASSTRADARRFLDEMRERLQEFALSLHPEKTRLIEFGRLAAESRKRRGLGKPETFNFLGFTFICGKTRRGKFQIKRKTRRDRMRAKLRKRSSRNCGGACISRFPNREVAESRSSPATSTTTRCRPTVATLAAFRSQVTKLWRRTLRQRSQKDWTTWERIDAAGGRLAPTTAISFTPGQSGALPSHTRGGSRMREMRPYGSVRGARGNSRPLYVADYSANKHIC